MFSCCFFSSLNTFTPIDLLVSNNNCRLFILLQLRVVKAFRSNLEDFEGDRRSIASTQSYHSMRGGSWSLMAQRASLTGATCTAPTDDHYQQSGQKRKSSGSQQQQLQVDSAVGYFGNHRLSDAANAARAGIASLMQRTTAPQPYPFYHHQQPRTPSPLPSPPPPPAAAAAAAMNHVGGGTTTTVRSDGTSVVVHDSDWSGGGGGVERYPLVQRWKPGRVGSGSSTARSIGKSISLDTPVSIAHV
jgi:hypothetical protein